MNRPTIDRLAEAPRTAGPAVAESEAQAAVAPAPLLHAALGLIPPSGTAADLEDRARRAGASLLPGVAERLLGRLAELGLVRVLRRDPSGPRYVTTSLGARLAVASANGQPAVSLEELERLRSDLLSTIAHELRTPLTAVRTSVGLLLEPRAHPTDEQRRALLDSIERNADRMQRLIDDILDLTRFRAGSVALQTRRFRAVELAEAVMAMIAPLAAKRGQELELEATVSREHAVYGDRRRLEQALLNLVSNAQKFSPDRSRIILRVEARGEHTAWVVADEGPGISEPDQARLFERFFVGRNDRPSAQEGVGLGLPTALAIAQAHGGTIEVRSRVAVGSTFALVVPTSGPEADEP
ncbi:MAG: HAMP domain-containing histidine kinase [Chloroflexi bacterium]|nr:HAMP domain-containing histidine kinase [Chloroflexota bacterium]